MNSKKEIEKVYKEAISKIGELKKKKKEIFGVYVKDLEQKKINSILNSLKLK